MSPPVLATHEWLDRALVRVIRANHEGIPVGTERELIQWGRAGREMDRSVWWTSTDIDGAAILDADRVEVIRVTARLYWTAHEGDGDRCAVCGRERTNWPLCRRQRPEVWP